MLSLDSFPFIVQQFIHRIYGFFITSRIKSLNVGKKTYISPKAQIIGWSKIKIGNYSCISDDCIINVNPSKLEGFALEIGNNCYLGRRSFISTGLRIEIGDYSLITNDCKLLGSGHMINNPFVPYICAGTTSDGIISIGTNCWLGSGVTILENVCIGYGSIIGAHSLVNKSVPPFSIAVGSPCKIIKRYSFKSKNWVLANLLIDEKDLGIPSEWEYLQILKEAFPIIPSPLHIASSKFGNTF